MRPTRIVLRRWIAALACAGLCVAGSLMAARAQAPAAGGTEEFRGYRPVAIVGEHLDGTPFNVPRGVYYDASQEEIFVADSGNGLIGIFDRAGVPKFAFAPGRRADYPTAITTDPEGRIYVLNAGTNLVAVFDYRGTPVRELSFGEVDRVEVLPSDLAMGPDGRLYLLDAGGGRILVYDLQGELVRVIGGKRRGGPRLLAPVSFAFDAEGRIYVSDRRGTPVQVYDADGSYLRGWGKRELGTENFSTPSGIAVDPAGHVLVADAVRQEVKTFDAEGTFLGSFGGFGQEPGQVAYPVDVTATPDGRILVVERVGRRLQILEPIPAAGALNGAASSKTHNERSSTLSGEFSPNP